ncbi:hypothetical protein K438DRAFT_1788137 [Mycena galopus ATCC 62051]|nr:hypothetical protein K438DRAFT_1788137 [Mycena galopus ATCC 62051]
MRAIPKSHYGFDPTLNTSSPNFTWANPIKSAPQTFIQAALQSSRYSNFPDDSNQDDEPDPEAAVDREPTHPPQYRKGHQAPQARVTTAMNVGTPTLPTPSPPRTTSKDANTSHVQSTTPSPSFKSNLSANGTFLASTCDAIPVKQASTEGQISSHRTNVSEFQGRISSHNASRRWGKKATECDEKGVARHLKNDGGRTGQEQPQHHKLSQLCSCQWDWHTRQDRTDRLNQQFLSQMLEMLKIRVIGLTHLLGTNKRDVSLDPQGGGIVLALIMEGLIPCAPLKPSVAITVKVLEVHRVAHARCPQLAMQSFVKTLCGGEDKLIFDILVTMDNNNSLKRVLCCEKVHSDGDTGTGQEFVLGKSKEYVDNRDTGENYYLDQEKVNKWSKQCIAQMLPMEADESDEPNLCADRWKNMIEDVTAKMWGVFDKTGIFLCLYQHGFVLIIMDMIKSGELYIGPPYLLRSGEEKTSEEAEGDLLLTVQMKLYRQQKERFNDSHMDKFRSLAKMKGFTGSISPGRTVEIMGYVEDVDDMEVGDTEESEDVM